MSVFSYQARERSGRAVSGTVEAEDRSSAAALLRQQGYLITKLDENRGKTGTGSASRRARVKLTDLVLFTRQFSVMVGAGLPVVSALRTAARQAEKPAMRKAAEEVASQVESGLTLSESIRRQRGAFPELYSHMVEAGETGGMLDTVLVQLAEHYEKELRLRKRIIGAVTYPAIILSFSILMVVLVVTFLVPRFTSLFTSMNAELPAITQGLMNLSMFFRTWFVAILMALGALLWGLRAFWTTKAGKELGDRIVLRVPVFGPLMKKVTVTRFSRTLGMLLGGGIPMLQCLDVAAGVSTNSVVAQAIRQAIGGVRQGSGIAKPLEATGIFPPMVTGMIAVGEESGQLESMLAQVADFYDMEVDNVVNNLTTLIEPFLLIGLGVIMAFIVAAILLPMFGMIGAVSI